MKAVVLISGGLDSALAAKVVRLQGIDVIGLAFITPFMYPQVEKLAQNIGIEIKLIDISPEYLDLIKNPCFGFGKNLNPCIDCHIFMLKRAKEFMPEYKADFIITGEVLGQRPMSQNRPALRKIERQAGLDGLLLRPLSAQLLPSTIPEEKGWVKRDRLFDFSGRSRKPQLELAKQLGLEGFSQPAGGCLLTDPGFSRRLKDLMTFKRDFNLDDIEFLKLGRHFRITAQAKLILGRNQEENQRLISLLQPRNLLLKPMDIPGPTGILKARVISRESLELSASILARYCDQNNGGVRISIEGDKDREIIHCSAMKPEELGRLRI
jgi:tRNA U34 2-thiouridine synthase MnmA/TrmU